MTKQEKRLWYDFLSSYPVKIYRQKLIDNYIADFYCDKAKLIIELDGRHHNAEDNIEYDDIRTRFFNSLEIKVIRFANNDCDTNFESVCASIDAEIRKRC